jgi:ribonuclease E
MLIDATHPEETRVVVLRNGRVEEFDYESAARKLLRGNIYLAKVTRVEPSLQAAFIDYGGNRHGFLAFNEIHPDYYQIPVADRQALLEEEAAQEAAEEAAADAHAERLARRRARQAEEREQALEEKRDESSDETPAEDAEAASETDEADEPVTIAAGVTRDDVLVEPQPEPQTSHGPEAQAERDDAQASAESASSEVPAPPAREQEASSSDNGGVQEVASPAGEA